MKNSVFVFVFVFVGDSYASDIKPYKPIQHGSGGDLFLILPMPFYEISITSVGTPVIMRGKISYILAAGKVSAEVAIKNVINNKYDLYVSASGVFVWSMGGVAGEIGIEFPRYRANKYWRLGILYGKFTESETDSALSRYLILPTVGIGQRF